MARQEPMEPEINSWFRHERETLHAPSDLWDSLEPNLGAQNRPGWRQLFGFRWVAVRLTVRAASIATFIFVGLFVMLAITDVGPFADPRERFVSDSGYGMSREQWDQLGRSTGGSAQPTATAAPTFSAGQGPAVVTPLLGQTETDSSAFRARQNFQATAVVGPGQGNVIVMPDGGLTLNSSFNWNTRITRDQAEALVNNALANGYGVTAEEYDLLVEEIMVGDWSRVPSDLRLTYFQDYGINPFVDPSDEPFSTFAMDVDTASYTITRSYLESGRIPPFESVRIEEFVNYFDQGYSQPDGTFGIHVDGSSNPYMDDGSFLVRIGVNTQEVSNFERSASNIVLVVDTSGSMRQGNRIATVRHGIQSLIDQLQPGDTIGIVAYNNEASIILSPTSDFRAASHSVDRLVPEGSTNVQAGLRLGFSLANQHFGEDKTNHVILLSDGVANVGTTDSNVLLSQISEYAKDGISLSTVGVGMSNYNDVLLERLANNGDGSYAYIDTFDQAEKTLGSDLTGLLEIVALEGKIQVEFDPEMVDEYRLVGYENRALATEDFRDDSVDAGEVGAGHSVTALYEVKMRAEDIGGPIGTIRVRWLDPDSREASEVAQTIHTDDFAKPFESASPRFRFTSSVMAFAEVLRQNPRFIEVSMLEVIAALAGAAADIPNNAEEQEFLSLVNKARELGAFTGFN